MVVALVAACLTVPSESSPLGHADKLVDKGRVSVTRLGAPTTSGSPLREYDERRRVLVLSDNRRLASFISGMLRSAQRALRVEVQRSLAAAAKGWPADVLLIDIDTVGTEPLRDIHTHTRSPMTVVALTQRDDLAFRVDLLNGGADSVVRVPCAASELCAVILAALRRIEADADHGGAILRIDDLRINAVDRTVQVGQRTARLTTHELGVLIVLAVHVGMTVSHDQILDAVWGVDVAATTNIVERHISALRAKLGDREGRSRHIETIRGRGYRLRDPARGVRTSPTMSVRA